MAARSTASSGLAAPHARDVLQPALATAILKYHSIPRVKLVAQTELGLASAGVIGVALGDRTGDQITLSSCINLTAHARELLPPALGGSPRIGGFGSAASSPHTPRPATHAPASPSDPESLAAALAQATASTREAAAAAAAASAARERLASLRPRARRAALQEEDDEPMPIGTTNDPADAEILAAAAAEASALTRAAAAAQAQADDDVASVASSLRPRSPAWSAPRSVSPVADADPTREQQNLVASVTALAHSTDAVAVLTGFRKRYPNIHRAFLARAATKGEVPAFEISSFPPTILVPAVHAARAQEHGLLTLRASSSASASLAGAHGATAAARLDALFDYSAAQAITHCSVGLEFSPLDVCLGVLPLTQLALHFWYRDHCYHAPAESPLIAAAARIKFSRSGVLDPGAGLAEFLPLWGAALGAEDDIPSPLIYYHISRALLADAEPTGSAMAVSISGSLTTWTTFALDTASEYDSRTRGSLDVGAARPHTLTELESLIFKIERVGGPSPRLARPAPRPSPSPLRPTHHDHGGDSRRGPPRGPRACPTNACPTNACPTNASPSARPSRPARSRCPVSRFAGGDGSSHGGVTAFAWPPATSWPTQSRHPTHRAAGDAGICPAGDPATAETAPRFAGDFLCGHWAISRRVNCCAGVARGGHPGAAQRSTSRLASGTTPRRARTSRAAHHVGVARRRCPASPRPPARGHGQHGFCAPEHPQRHAAPPGWMEHQPRRRHNRLATRRPRLPAPIPSQPRHARQHLPDAGEAPRHAHRDVRPLRPSSRRPSPPLHGPVPPRHRS